MKELIKRTISLALAFLLLFSGSGVLATPMKAYADEYEEAIGENEYQTVTGADQDEYDYLPDEVSETAPVEQETTAPEYRNAPTSGDQEPTVEETEVQETTEEVPETTEEPAETESEVPAGETEEYVEETQIETEEEQPVTEEATEEPSEETNQPEPENASAETTEPEEDSSDPAAETETELPEAPSENEDNDSEGSNTDEGQDEMTEDGAYVPSFIFLPAYPARGTGDGYKVIEGNWREFQYHLTNFNGNAVWKNTDFPWMAASEDEALQVGSDMWIYCYNFGTRTENGTYVASSLSDDDRWSGYPTNIKMRMMLAWILGANNYGEKKDYVATQWVIWEYSDFGRTSGTSTTTSTFTMSPEITAIRNRLLHEIDEAMVLPSLNTTSVSLNGIGSAYKQTITDRNNVLNKKNAANYTYWHVVPQDNTISATVNASGKLEIYANKYFNGTKTVTLTRNDDSKKVEGGFAYAFDVENQKAFLGQPEDEQKIVVNVTMQPKYNFRMYKVIVDQDGNEVTRDNPEGFALRVRNPALGKSGQIYYARSNSSGEFYSTNSSYAAVESNQTKVFSKALINGEEIEFYEDAAHSRDQSYAPRTAALHIKDASGNNVSVIDMSIVPRVSGGQVVGYYLTDGVNDTGKTEDHCFKIRGLQTGYSIAIKVKNRPTVKIRIKKASNTASKEGFAFTWRSYQTDDTSTWFYGKSDSKGNVYKTNSSFATVTSNKVYDLEYIQDGFIALSEDIGHSQSTNYRPKKVTVVIKDAKGKVVDSDYGSGVVVRSSANNTWWITDGVADTNDTQGRDRYFYLSGLKAGYTVTFIVSNTTTSTFSAIKLDFSNTHKVAGIKFKLYKRSKTGTTWSHVADFTTTSVSDTSQTYSEYNESYAAKSKYDTRTYGTKYGKIDIPTTYLNDNYIYRLSEVLPSGYTGMAENWRDKPVYTNDGETVVIGEEFSPSDGSYVGVFTNDSKHNMTMSKTITSGYGGTVQGFAFRISCKSNGYYQYGISDASGNIYRTKASYTASNDASNYTPIANASSRVYTFDNLRNGYIAIMEDMNASTQHEFIPKSATVKVVDGNGTVKKTIRCSIVENNDDHRYYFTDGVAEDWDPEGRDRYLLIKELRPGYALTVAVENEPTYKLTLSKSVEGNGSLDGFAFRIYNKDTGTYEYFKTDEEGKAYRTTYEDGVFEDVPAADRKYEMEGLKNGQQISILELMPYSTHSMYIPKSVKIKVYDANGTLKKTVNCSVTERNPTTHDRCYYFGDNVVEETTGNDLYVALDNLNLKYGYNISIEVLNEPTHMLTIQKQVNNDTESKAGFAFRLYCTGNPTNEKYLWGVSDTDGRVFRTAASSTTADQSYAVPSTKTYDFELREGRVSILEDLPNSTHPKYIPSYATIRVYAENGRLKRTIRRCKITPHGSKANCYYFGDNVAEDENGTDVWIDFQNLDPGDSIVISIGNDSLHTMTLRKSVDVASGHKDGFCFRIFSYGAGEYQWGKSGTDGRIFKTGVTSNTTADESFETPATKEYTFTGIRSGYLSILEKIPQSTYTKFIPTSATVRIYNEDGTQDGSDIVCSVVERNSETHDRCYFFVDGITDWNGDTDRYLYLDLKYGQTIDIELHNTSLHDMTIKKTVDGSGAVDGFAFRVYSVGEDFQWGKSAATTGNVFKTNTSSSYHADTAADYALENGTDYNFNIRNGLISVFENLRYSTYPNYVPVSATIKVMGENGQQKRVINCTVKKHATASDVWMFTDNLPDSSGSSTDNSMLIDNLEYGDNLVMEIHNEGIHTMTITKSVNGASNQVDGFAFRVHNQNKNTYIYGKSAETTGKVFVTSTSTSATPTATSYNTPSGTLSYQFDIKSGLISILEDIDNSTHSDCVPTAATIRIRDENGAQVGQAITATIIKRSGSSNTYYITDGVNESDGTDRYFDFSNLGYGQTIDVQLTNSKLLSLDITKQVRGQMGSRNQAFRFVLSTTPPIASMAGMRCAVTKTTASGSTSSLTPLTLGQNYTFTLKSGENVHVDGLPAGTTYSIIESPSGSNQGYEGYTTSWKVGSTSAGTGASLSAKTLSASTTVTVTNSCGTTPPTGVFDNSLPVIMLTATMLLSAAVLLEAQRRKRKNAENQ